MIEHYVKTFLKKHAQSGKMILLGLSGGPDSLLLFHLLLKRKVDFAAAHVNHCLRTESHEEAKQLQQLAQWHQVPFYLHTLDPSKLSGNLEDCCRQERLNFFSTVSHDLSAQAVILGHHADDQAETTLKRILEGSSLQALSGIKEISSYNGLILWRPLLKFRKKEILQWFKKHRITPFFDSTNMSCDNLRGKMRSQIIPYLTDSFGKEVTNNLCHLALDAEEISNYLMDRVSPLLSQTETGPLGCLLDLTKEKSLSLLEIKTVVRALCQKASVTLSRKNIEIAANLLLIGVANRELHAGNSRVYIDRKRIFLQKKMLPTVEGYVSIDDRNYGEWRVDISIDGIENRSGWKQVWLGNCSIHLPDGQFSLGPADASMDKIWTHFKVPAFLRKSVPVIWSNGKIYHEFLSGQKPKQTEITRWVTLLLI